jgi:hypothetical protein
MMMIYSYCYFYKNYTGDENIYTCKAFPEGIPDEIYSGPFNHKTEYPGDNGYRFEPDYDVNLVRHN